MTEKEIILLEEIFDFEWVSEFKGSYETWTYQGKMGYDEYTLTHWKEEDKWDLEHKDYRVMHGKIMESETYYSFEEFTEFWQKEKR